ncbi:Splicing factor 3b subunit [Thalictrum thalictroides]|uniref:Splicing factor 3b subunit n=1 Tax=Thalictrum thalictroides TaxID=46969 RepID=A0A7J6X9T6_THATH|nr:Splicing factor 3b subunit [Thalictrum thalictroides]
MNIAELKQISSRPDVVEVRNATAADPKLLAYIGKEDSKMLKLKQRERMQPKMGKMDVDYQVFNDAFFKNKTKPKLTARGDLYYEGKEYEVKLREMKPASMLLRELKEALGVPDEGAAPP